MLQFMANVGLGVLRAVLPPKQLYGITEKEPEPMNTYLKIKVKSLAAEAVLIRQEERRIKAKHAKWRAKAASRAGTPPPAVFFGLKDHRTAVLRQEARSSHLAYGFLRGNAYHAMEATCRAAPDWKRVEELVKKYGTDDIRDRMQRFSAWKDAQPAPAVAAA